MRRITASLSAILITGCAGQITSPASYTYEHTSPDGARCAITVNSDRDISALGMDITEQCAVNLRAGTLTSENISDVIESVPVGDILPISGLR